MPVIVYEYGLSPPKVNAALVEDQFRLAHKYRNMLTEIELERRAKIRAVMASHPDMVPFETELAEVLAEIEKLRGEINEIRKVERKRSSTPAQSKRIKELSARARVLRSEIKERRKRVASEVKPELDAIQAAAVQRRKDERAKCGVYWGTYLLQEAAADQARDQPMPPKFSRWNGDGRVSVQIQQGLPKEGLWGESRQVQIATRIDSTVYDSEVTRRGDRRRLYRTTLRMRVGSTDRQPVWAEWGIAMHRPIPDGAVVKVVTVSRRRCNSTQWWWRVQFTLDITDCKPKQRPEYGVVACNLGFSQAESGAIRAGYLVGDDGFEQEILVAKSDLYRGRDLTPEQKTKAMTYVRDCLAESSAIRGERDKSLAEFKVRFLEWYEDFKTKVDEDTIPEWLRDRMVHFSQWRSPARVREMMLHWASNSAFGHFYMDSTLGLHPSDDVRGFQMMSAWVDEDTKAEVKESSLRNKALGDRREAYRIVAAALAKRYKTLLIDDTNLKHLQDGPDPEDDKGDIPAVKYQQRLAAGSELRQVLINAFGTNVVKMKPTNMTVRCAGCGSVDVEWDRADGFRKHRCSACREIWDQDANFCRNLLKEYARGGETPAAKLAKPSRSQRFHESRKKTDQQEQGRR
jgi:hypothetical protein